MVLIRVVGIYQWKYCAGIHNNNNIWSYMYMICRNSIEEVCLPWLASQDLPVWPFLWHCRAESYQCSKKLLKRTRKCRFCSLHFIPVLRSPNSTNHSISWGHHCLRWSGQLPLLNDYASAKAEHALFCQRGATRFSEMPYFAVFK